MIPAELIRQKPMLAEQSKRIAPTPDATIEALFVKQDGWIADLKHDGVRCLAFVSEGQPHLVNRRSSVIDGRYPELMAALRERFAGQDVVLDCEIICLDPTGKPAFDLIHRRDAQSNAATIKRLAVDTPATLVAFDVLYLDGTDLRRRPYEARLGALIGLDLTTTVGPDSDGRLRQTVATRDGQLLWQHVKAHGLEGIIAKKLSAPYRGRRDSAWVKIKQAFSVSAIVIGCDAGSGRRAATFGALNLGLIRDGQPIEWGQVGTGFTDADLAIHRALLDSGKPYVVEIEIAAITRAENKPRFPALKGIRTDVDLIDCDWSQLEGVPVV